MKMIGLRFAILSRLGRKVVTFGEEVAVQEGFGTDSRCRVCKSPHRLEYEEHYLAVQNLKEVWAYAQDLGEDISYESFKRHFRRHFNPRKALEKRSREMFEEAVKERMDYAQRLGRKFLLADALVEKLLCKVGEMIDEKGGVEGREVVLLKTLLSELRAYAREIKSLIGEEFSP